MIGSEDERVTFEGINTYENTFDRILYSEISTNLSHFDKMILSCCCFFYSNFALF